MPPDEREGRCEINSDLCVIDEEGFFIRRIVKLSVTPRP
ncbi:hypothetical protein H1230_13030 [Paenibacillus sp. 19GGS1-52]|nr:hypothetical protein H1230_13030 [Paenibacillus sp. 19GGS1-52]